MANGTRLHFYNSPGWLLRIDGDRFTEDITHATGWGGVSGYYDGRIKTTSFVYNWAGKPADYAVQYTYDNLGQLTTADNNINNAWDIGVANSISYDANGNILDLTRGSSTKTYAYYTGTNKVQNTDGSGNDYVYDSNANVTNSSPKSINTITYDSFTRRPTSVSMSSGASLTLEYGGDTQRVLKNYTSGGNTNSKLYLHGQNDYPLIERNKTAATAETLATYLYGLNGVIAKRAGSTVLFLLKGQLGSTRVVMDATGLVRTYYDYDALGNVIRIGTTNELKYQFTGQEVDESSLHNYRARLYDSDLGKFYAVDPAGQDWSPFAYAGNNPVIFVDADGRAWFVPVIIGIGILSGGYSGYQIAEAKGESELNALGYVLAGAAIGGISAYLGATSAAQVGGVFSGGISTFTNSFGMMMLSGGQIGLSSQLGPLTISEKGFKLANPFKDRGALRSLMGWATLAGDLYSLYGHYRENQRISREVPELSGRNKEVEQMWEDSLNPNRHPAGRIHEEGAWMSEEGFSRVPPGEGATIDLGPKPDWATSNIHTHPNFGIDPIVGKEWAPGASSWDMKKIESQKIIQAVVVAGKHNQIHIYYSFGSYPIGAYDKFVYKWWLYRRF